MALLAIDCAFSVLSIGIQRDDYTRVVELGEVRQHSRDLLGEIHRLLEEEAVAPRDLQAIAFSQGPGSFTGLRIATGVVQGLAYGLNCAVVPIPSMAAIASQVFSECVTRDVVVALHARADEVYLAQFDQVSEVPQRRGGYHVSQVQTLADDLLEGRVLAGSGVSTFLEHAPARVAHFDQLIEIQKPNLVYLLRLAALLHDRGEVVSALEAAPLYVREEVAQRPVS